MVTHLSLDLTNIVVNGTCFVDLDYITVAFRSNCFMISKDLNNTYCFPCNRKQCDNCFRTITLMIKLSNYSL